MEISCTPKQNEVYIIQTPMSISISEPANKKEYWFENFQGKMFKMRLPKSGGGKTLVGITCGYLVFFGTKPREFQLLNPVTRRGLRFPKVPSNFDPDDEDDDDDREGVIRAILVFSQSKSAWVLVVLCRYTSQIWFSISGTREWNCVFCRNGIVDVHEFKGKLYAIDNDSRFYEVRLDSDPKLTLLRTHNRVGLDLVCLEFVCTRENLFAIQCLSWDEYKAHKLDFGEMKWVSPGKKTLKGYAFFVCDLKHSAAIKPETELWFDSWLRYKRRYISSGNEVFFNADIWYFPHDCLKVNLKLE